MKQYVLQDTNIKTPTPAPKAVQSIQNILEAIKKRQKVDISEY